jgi:hypothetical protein
MRVQDRSDETTQARTSAMLGLRYSVVNRAHLGDLKWFSLGLDARDRRLNLGELVEHEKTADPLNFLSRLDALRIIFETV